MRIRSAGREAGRYKLLFHMDSVDMYTDSDEKDEQARFYQEMMKALVSLEDGLKTNP